MANPLKECLLLVGDEKIATISLHQDKPEESTDQVYPLPESMTQACGKVTVKFHAHPGDYAGGVFGVRVVMR